MYHTYRARQHQLLCRQQAWDQLCRLRCWTTQAQQNTACSYGTLDFPFKSEHLPSIQPHIDVTFAFYTVLCGTVQNTARGVTGGTSRTLGHTARTASPSRPPPTTIVRLAAGSVPRFVRSFSYSLPRMRTSHDTRRFIGYKTHSRLLCILRCLKTFTVTLHKKSKCDFQHTASGSRTENFQVPLISCVWLVVITAFFLRFRVRSDTTETTGGSGYVGSEVYTIFGALFKKNNIKLRIRN